MNPSSGYLTGRFSLNMYSQAIYVMHNNYVIISNKDLIKIKRFISSQVH